MSGSALPPASVLPAESGSIYDIGYRRYEGPRLGRSHAIRSLFWHTLRSAYGIGRGGRAKIAPLTLGFLACIPALAIVAAQALLRQVPGGGQLEDTLPVRYDSNAGIIGLFIILFCAAQAPDLFGRDQRFSLLSLYFSRAIRRTDYAIARLAGFMVAVFVLQLLPNLLLYAGQVLLATDVVKGALDDAPAMARVVVQAALTAGILGGLSMAVAAYTPRRAYAVAGIIALFVIPGIVVTIVGAIGAGDLGQWLFLLSPTTVLEGTNAFLFDVRLSEETLGGATPPPDWAFLLAAAGWIAAGIVLTLRRFLRVGA